MITPARFRDGDTHRNTLHDFREISRRVVGRKERELCPRCSTDARDFPVADATAVGIDLELHWLARADRGELGFFEVRSHPDPCIGNDAEERLARRDELSHLDLFSRHLARRGRGNPGVIELQLSVLGGCPCCHCTSTGNTDTGFCSVYRSPCGRRLTLC